MQLLWIPHCKWSQGVGHRSRYVIDHLKARDEVHVVTWSEPETPHFRDFANPTKHLRALIPSDATEDGVIVHHVPRWCFHRIPYLWRQNQRFLQEAVREIVRDNDVETIVFGPSAYLMGYPPTDTNATLVFDYVDYLEDQFLSDYLKRANAVICASRLLQRQVETLGYDASYIPNGVDFEKFRTADGLRVREHYDLQDNLVISLIGLTCSPDLYFVNSLFRVHRKIPHVAFLFVGKGPQYRHLRGALRRLDDACIWTGWVPYEKIHDFFLATDIGLYPGAATQYFRAACPIKILEYAVAEKPTVSSRVEEVDVLGLTNVIQVASTADSYYNGILAARSLSTIRNTTRIPSWRDVADRFEAVIGREAG